MRRFLVIVVAIAINKPPRIFYSRVYATDRVAASVEAWNRRLRFATKRSGYTWAGERTVAL